MSESQRHPTVTEADVGLVGAQLAAHPVLSLLALQENAPRTEPLIRDCAGKTRSALAAAGRLLPAHAETEYGVQWHGLDVVPVDAERAMSTARRFQNAVAVRRMVGPWQPVPTTEGENP